VTIRRKKKEVCTGRSLGAHALYKYIVSKFKVENQTCAILEFENESNSESIQYFLLKTLSHANFKDEIGCIKDSCAL